MIIDSVSETEKLYLPDAPIVPGLTFRLFRDESDYAAIASVSNVYNRAMDIEEIHTAEMLENSFSHTLEFDPRRDVLLAELDGQVIGHSRTWFRPLDDGTLIYVVHGCLLPDWARRGIGRAMRHYSEQHVRRLAADRLKTAPSFFQSFAMDSETGKRALLQSEGYAPVRHFCLMVRPNLDEIPDLPLPTGLEVKPIEPQHYRSVYLALNEAFRDHWGHSEQTSEDDYQRFINDPQLQPKLWQVAFAGDEVAGMVLNFIDTEENKAYQRLRGYPDPICVRRPWRKQGLASALIARSLRLLKERGMTEAALGVDSENPNGAFNIYQNLGFHPVQRSASYRKPIE